MATEGQTMAIASGKNRKARREIGLYWTFTLLLLAQMTLVAIALIVRPPAVATLIRHLGYPDYFPMILGIAKLLAVVGIAQPWFATLKEWAYAGATFDVFAAFLSHVYSHDPAKDIAGPLLILVLVAFSYSFNVRVKRRA